MKFNKELSWLSFNERVLQEAADQTVPLIERIRFLGIYSSNLDEFFRVRVAGIRRKAILESAHEGDKDKWHVINQKINDKVNVLTKNFNKIAQEIFSQLSQENIFTIFNDHNNSPFNEQLNHEQLLWLEEYFDHRIIRHITPIILHSKTQLANCIDDDGIYFLVALHHQENLNYALVEIPRYDIERFIVLPNDNHDTASFIVLL
ncbi:MAG: polyphosphate kinase 1, partial [Colwelliaceae bacterium]|nr:polyphosphate kinase 1 [Colwelliaceae bacterium]